jgi:adenosylcobinamide kinase/adenosylcobinamide-phosphate guanylyltransferase
LALASGSAVIFIATAEALDDEMATRIERHRAARPSTWTTIEEPVAPASAVRSCPGDVFVVVDCLTLWISNILDESDEAILAAADDLAGDLGSHPGGGVVVSNEVGDCIVPADPESRRYRDLLGRVNSRIAAGADRSYLVVAGRVLGLEAMPW